VLRDQYYPGGAQPVIQDPHTSKASSRGLLVRKSKPYLFVSIRNPSPTAMQDLSACSTPRWVSQDRAGLHRGRQVIIQPSLPKIGDHLVALCVLMEVNVSGKNIGCRSLPLTLLLPSSTSMELYICNTRLRVSCRAYPRWKRKSRVGETFRKMGCRVERRTLIVVRVHNYKIF
jgi:hypothetical protein